MKTNTLKHFLFLSFLSLSLSLYPNTSQGFVGSGVSLFDDIYKAYYITKNISRTELSNLLVSAPYSVRGFMALNKVDKMRLYSKVATSKGLMVNTKQTYYINKFSKIKNGDEIFINAVKNNKNLSEILAQKYLIQETKNLPLTLIKRTQGQAYGAYKNVVKFPVKNIYGKIIGSYSPNVFYDINKAITMPSVIFTQVNKTTTGYLRNSKIFWNKYSLQHSKDLSNKNLGLIREGQSPIVDKVWIRAYPKHKPFKGEILEHHHINHGGVTVPLPKTLHRVNGNYKIFHSL